MSKGIKNLFKKNKKIALACIGGFLGTTVIVSASVGGVIGSNSARENSSSNSGNISNDKPNNKPNNPGNNDQNTPGNGDNSSDDVTNNDDTTSEPIRKYARTPAQTLEDQLLPEGMDPKNFYPNFFIAQKDKPTLEKIFDSTNPSKADSFMSDAYIDNAIKTNTLKQHPAAKYMYKTFVEDDVLAVSKNLSFDFTRNGWHSTGLFIPPGEIVNLKFEGMTDEEVAKLNLSIVVGSSEATNANRKYTQWYQTRMPNIIKIKKIDKADFSYGTPFGGLISIDAGMNLERPKTNVKIQINNAVEALYYVHGKTTEKEWNRLRQEAKAPVFDIGCDTVEFLGQNHYLTNYKDDISVLPYPKEVMELYRKLTSSSLIAANKFNLKQPTIRIHYSNYLHTSATASQAAAVSIIGSWYVTYSNTGCANLLDIKRVSGGDWGTIHEFNHQLQLDRYMTTLQNNPFDSPAWRNIASPAYWGFGGMMEVSNNTLNIMSFINYLNLQNDRSDPTNKNLWVKGHGWKFNGYTVAKKLNEQNSRSWSAKEQHYMSVMSLFGTKDYSDIVKTFFDPYTKDYKGDVITVPWYIRDYDLNASFVYRISMVTGYDWSDFFNSFGLLDKALKPSDVNRSLNDARYNPPMKNKTPYQKLQGMKEIQALPKVAPAYSFYASEVSYNKSDDFREIARPMVVSGTSPTTLKIEEYTSTYNNLYNLNNVEIVQQPKYGTLSEKQGTNGKKEFIYTPDQSHKNDLDEFIYKVKSTQKNDVNSSNINRKDGTKATESTNNKLGSADIYFKVQMYQNDGTYKWTSPEVNNEIENIEPVLTAQSDKIDLANVKAYNATNDKEPVLNEPGTKIAANLFDGNFRGTMWDQGQNFGRLKIEIPFKEQVNLNTLTIMPWRTNFSEIPTDIEIQYKDSKDGQMKRILYDSYTLQYKGQLSRVETSTYTFSDITTDKIVFYANNRNEKGDIQSGARFKFAQLSFGYHTYQKVSKIDNQNTINVVRKHEY